MMEDVLERNEEAVDRWIGLVLLVGLLLAIAVMVIGLVMAAIEGASATRVLPLDKVLPELGRGTPAAVLDAGILLLFAAPLAGVITALLGFIFRRNGTFVGITGALLVLLLVGFAVALR